MYRSVSSWGTLSSVAWIFGELSVELAGNKFFMRYSKSFAKTQKEVPKDVTVVSHQYLIRGGFIDQLAAGLYSFLPFGFRVLMKIDQIVREELSKQGVEHLLMPFVHPASLWKESGRYDSVDVLLKFKSARGADCVLAPTHEETVTDLARKFVRTYKDLPVILNQNQWKYRDEVRATGGLLRTREFLMQDAYSFDKDREGLDESFKSVRKAYHAIFERMGLDVLVVKADSGAMGGSDSEEFMVVSEVGEDRVFVCDSCDYQANREKAESKLEAFEQDTEMKTMERVEGKGIVGVEDLAKHLGVEPYQTSKTLLFRADKEFVAVMIRGDLDVNETKLQNYLGCGELELASAAAIKELTGAEVGYMGPVNLPESIRLVADLSCEGRVNFEAGGNETDYHNINVNFERDFPTPDFADLREVKDGDVCVACGKGHLSAKSAIEVGHVFKLGTKYSDSMKANFVDSDGKSKPIIMGCYGIGISRLVAATIEASHDDKGMIWPVNIAPFHVQLVMLGNDDEVRAEAEALYTDLVAQGVEVLFDDRDESAGFKFKDADLIGLPLRLVVSKKMMEQNAVEWKERKADTFEVVERANVIARVHDFLSL